MFSIVFAPFPKAHEIYEMDQRLFCTYKDGFEDHFGALNTIWIVLYIMLPTLILICFNIAITIQLRKIKRIYKTMAKQHAALSSNRVSVHPVKVPSTSHTPSDDNSSIAHTVDNTDFTTSSAETTSQSPEMMNEEGKSREKIHVTLPDGVK